MICCYSAIESETVGKNQEQKLYISAKEHNSLILWEMKEIS